MNIIDHTIAMFLIEQNKKALLLLIKLELRGSWASGLLAPLILLVFRSEVAFSIWHVYTFWHKVSSSTNDPKSERRLGFRLNVSRMPCRHKTMSLLFVLANIILFRRYYKSTVCHFDLWPSTKYNATCDTFPYTVSSAFLIMPSDFIYVAI